MTLRRAYRTSLLGHVAASIVIVPLFSAVATLEDIWIFLIARLGIFVTFLVVQVRFMRELWSRPSGSGGLSHRRIIGEWLLSHVAAMGWPLPVGWLLSLVP